MGQKQSLELSGEEKKEFALDLLREWWMTAVQALTDATGEESAIQRLTPYTNNSDMALGQNMPQILNIQERSLEMTHLIMGVVNNCVCKTTHNGLAIGKSEITDQARDCCTRGVSRVVCWVLCENSGIFAETLCPGIEYRLTSSLSWGNPCCRWVWKDRRAPDDEDKTERNLPVISLPDDMKNQLSLHFLGELWTIAIKAYIDHAGSDKAVEKLDPYMRHSGLSIGNHLVKEYKISTDLESLKNIIRMIGEMDHMKGTLTASSNSFEYEIYECPFSDGPQELCLQYSSFFNGFIEAVNPTYEFAYDRMMTKGHKTCHWIIRKKGEAAEEKVKGESVSDDPIKTLTMRFAKGEITEEELEKKIAHLKKLGLMK